MARSKFQIILTITFFLTISALAFASANDSSTESPDKEPAKNSGRKKFLETSIGTWKISPGLAFKFGRGYDFSIGPKINLKKNLDSTKSIIFSAYYLPVRFRDIDAELKQTSFSFKFRNFFRPRFFFELGAGLNSFVPDSKTKAYVASRGGKISSENIMNASFSIAYQIYNVNYSYKQKKRKLPIYCMITYRESDSYEFGTEIGQAGDEFKSSRKGVSFRVFPLFRQF